MRHARRPCRLFHPASPSSSPLRWRGGGHAQDSRGRRSTTSVPCTGDKMVPFVSRTAWSSATAAHAINELKTGAWRAVTTTAAKCHCRSRRRPEPWRPPRRKTLTPQRQRRRRPRYHCRSRHRVVPTRLNMAASGTLRPSCFSGSRWATRRRKATSWRRQLLHANGTSVLLTTCMQWWL